MTNSSRLSSLSKCVIGLGVILAVSLLTLGLTGYFDRHHYESDPDPSIDVVIKNDSSIPIQDAHLWLKDSMQDVPVILPGHSASLTIYPPGESNLELEFSRGKNDWRHCLFFGYAESATFPIRIDDEGTCIETGHKLPSAILTRPWAIPIVSPGSTSRPPYTDRQDQIRIRGEFKAINLEHAPTKGPATATVTVVESCGFADPECSQYAHIAQQLLAAYPTQVRVVFKHYFTHYPQPEESWIAHEAALAAGDQRKFWQMHDLLFASQDKLTRDDLKRRAKQLKLDVPRFESDLDSHRYRPVVDADHKEFLGAGLFIGRYSVGGARDLADYKRVVDFVLKEAATGRK